MESFSSQYIGKWKIIEYIPEPSIVEDYRFFQNREFELTSERDVIWSKEYPNNDPNREEPPLFHCKTYEVSRGTRKQGTSRTVLRFGSYKGSVIEFKVENELVGPDERHLQVYYLVQFDWGTLRIQRQKSEDCTEKGYTEKVVYGQFDMISALEESLFTDHVLVSASGTEFRVHRLLLDLVLPSSFDSTQFSDTVLKIFLHYCYGECLPESISDTSLLQCQEEFQEYAHQSKDKEVDSGFMKDFGSHCGAAINKIRLRKKIVILVHDIHTYLNVIITEFGGKPVSLNNDSRTSKSQRKSSISSSENENLIGNETKLSCSIKTALQSIALGILKFIHLSHTLSKALFEEEMSLQDQHDIIRSVQSSCLPIFVSQIHRFISTLLRHSESLSLEVRQSLSERLIPRVETLFETLSKIGLIINEILEVLFKQELSETRKICKYSSSNVRGSCLNNNNNNNNNQPDEDMSHLPSSPILRSMATLLRVIDCNKLRKVYYHINNLISFLVHEIETFSQMDVSSKTRNLSKVIEQYVDELPLLLLRFEEFSHKLHERFDFANFKFCFHAVSTFIESLVSKCIKSKVKLKPLFDNICLLIPLDEFRCTLEELGLLDPDSNIHSSTQKDANLDEAMKCSFAKSLSLMDNLFSPPRADVNYLATCIGKLLSEEAEGDVEFLIEPFHGEEEDKTESPVSIKVHGMIIASRCEWFRRALASGMKEAIEKKIVVTDVSPLVFRLFLKYIYSGSLIVEGLPVDQISELLLLSDRYEMDSLKGICESLLTQKISEDNVLELLSISDTYNSPKLKAKCIEYVHSNPDVMETDLFSELSGSLKSELYTLIYWGTRLERMEDKCTLLMRNKPRRRSRRKVGLGNRGFSEEDEYFSSFYYRGSRGESMESSSKSMASEVSYEESDEQGEYDEQDSLMSSPLTHDSNQLEMCIGQLRDVLGPLVPQDELVQVAIVANYDVNRALNHFFSSSSSTC